MRRLIRGAISLALIMYGNRRPDETIYKSTASMRVEALGWAIGGEYRMARLLWKFTR